MKYLDYPVLTHLSEVLSDNPSPEARINVRVEAYSIKPVAKERKMFKEMEEAYVSGQEEMEEMSFSPEMKEAGLSSCFGRLDVKESRKVHFLLVSTLNTAFPDNDFSALRPDHFTREISAGQVLSHLSSNLLGINAVDLSPLAAAHTNPPLPQQSSPPGSGSGGVPLSSSAGAASSPPLSGDIGNPSFYRLLNDILPLQDCEVYSWFPEPEYDPHVDPEENEEASEYDEEDSDDMIGNMDMDIDIDGEGPYVSWGQAGMDLEVNGAPSSSSSSMRPRSMSRNAIEDLEMGSPYLSASDFPAVRKVGGLLWSANYFFYSKRSKRVLFITTWARKRPSHEGAPIDETLAGSLPLPISASMTPPGFGVGNQTFTPRSPKTKRHHNLSNARPSHRRAKMAKLAQGKTLQTSTIPIRGLGLSTAPPPSTPSTGRMAASAPTPSAGLLSPSTVASPGAMTRMSGSLRPRQTTARMLINAAQQQQQREQQQQQREQQIQQQQQNQQQQQKQADRTRKERSGSLTPGPPFVPVEGGKRVKV